MASNIKGIKIEIGAETAGFQKSLKALDASTKKTQTELREVNNLLKLDPTNTELLAQKQLLLAKATEETKTKLKALQDAKIKADADMADGTEVNQEQYRKLQREIANTEQKLVVLETQTKQLNVTTKKSAEEMASSFEQFGTKSVSAGKKLMPLTLGVAAVGVTAGKMAIDFEDAMAKVSTIADTTKVPMADLEKSILDLSNQTGISSTLIADDVYNAISAGQDTADAVKFVEQSTKLAKAGFAESSQTLDVLTTILNAYGLEASETGKISDMLIQTQNKGKTTVAELSESMGKVIPTAKGQNVALEQLTTSYAIMTAKGIKATETTTYLNSMINELGKSGSKSSDVLKSETGKSFSELMASGKSLADVLQILKTNADKNNLSLGDMFGSAEAGKAGLTLLGDGADVFNTSLKEMLGSTGATETAFEKMQTTSQKFKEDINKLKNAGIELGKALLNVLAPVFEKISGTIKKLTQRFSSMSEEQKKTIINVSLVVASIAPLLIVIGKTSIGISSLIKTVKLLWVAISAHPIAAVLTALGLLVGAIVTYNSTIGKAQTETDKFCDATNKLIDKSKETTQAIKDSAESYEKQGDDILASAGASEILADKLFDLSEKENKTNSEKAIMKGLVEELNGLMPDLNLLFDEETGLLNKQRSEVGLLIEEHKKLALVKAAEERLTELAKQQIEKEFDLNKLIKNKAENQTKLNELEKEYQTIVGNRQLDSKEKFNQLDSVGAEIGKLKKTMKGAQTEITEAEKILNETKQDFDKTLDYIDQKSKTVAQLYDETHQRMGESAEQFRIRTGNALTGTIDDMVTLAPKIPEGVGLGITSNMTGVQNATANIRNTIKNGMSGLVGDLTSIGQNAMNSLNSTMQNMGGDLFRAMYGDEAYNQAGANLPMFANGGVLSNGQGIVAEAGPELITMINGRAIIKPLSGESRNTLVGGGSNNSSAKSYNQTVNVYSPQPLSPASTARQLRNSTKQMLGV